MEAEAAEADDETGLAEDDEMLTSALPSCADTVAEATPGTFASARSTAPEHDAQLIPFTSRRTISETPAARATPATAARKPTPSTAATRSEGLRTEASKVTSAASWRRATDAEWTPGRALLSCVDRKRERERVEESEGGNEKFEFYLLPRGLRKSEKRTENQLKTHLSAPSTAEEHEEQCIPWIESCGGF